MTCSGSETLDLMQDLTEGKDELLLINSRVPRGSGSDLYKKTELDPEYCSGSETLDLMQDLTEGKDELLLINSRVPRGSGSDLYKKKQNWILNTDQDQKHLISDWPERGRTYYFFNSRVPRGDRSIPSLH